MIGAHLASSALMKSAVAFGPRPGVGSTPTSCGALDHHGIVHRLLDRRVEPLDDRRRRAGRRKDRVPACSM
jgi:hypothetical protein